MAWKGWGEPLLTADATGVRVYSTFSFTQNAIIQAMRFRIIFYNDPTLTAVTGKIYHDNGATAPGELIASSTDSRAKAELNSDGNGLVETYLTFDKIPIRKSMSIHFVLNMTGYTGTAGSHIAWEKAYPDPVTPPSAHDYTQLLKNPFYCYPIFARL